MRVARELAQIPRILRSQRPEVASGQKLGVVPLSEVLGEGCCRGDGVTRVKMAPNCRLLHLRWSDIRRADYDDSLGAYTSMGCGGKLRVLSDGSCS